MRSRCSRRGIARVSVQPRDDSVVHKAPVLVPALPVLFPADLVVVQVPRDEQHDVVERVKPRKRRPRRKPAGERERASLHNLPEVVDVTADAPKAAAQYAVVRPRNGDVLDHAEEEVSLFFRPKVKLLEIRKASQDPAREEEGDTPARPCPRKCTPFA